jgi:CO dehydrogenase nickel-insertion accessory protein CooC1
MNAVEEIGVEVATFIPADENVNRMDALGEPLVNLDGDSPAWKAIDAMVLDLILS